MASKRNRILDLVEYLESLGLEVHLSKNKARGHSGFFKAIGKKYRIDIAKGLDENSMLRVLSHEFAHYFHYLNDRHLQDLGFIFENFDDDILDELLKLTVDSIPQESVAPLFNAQKLLKDEIQSLANYLTKEYKDFKLSVAYKPIEKKIKTSNLKYLLKYDRVKIFSGFGFDYYSIDDLKADTLEEKYLKLKSKQRALRRINSKISRLNKYYNSPTELFARSFEFYVMNREKLETIAPIVFSEFEHNVNSIKFPVLNKFINISDKILNN